MNKGSYLSSLFSSIIWPKVEGRKFALGLGGQKFSGFDNRKELSKRYELLSVDPIT